MVVDVDSVNCLTSRTTCYTVTDGDTSLQGLYTVCFAMSVKKKMQEGIQRNQPATATTHYNNNNNTNNNSNKNSGNNNNTFIIIVVITIIIAILLLIIIIVIIMIIILIILTLIVAITIIITITIIVVITINRTHVFLHIFFSSRVCHIVTVWKLCQLLPAAAWCTVTLPACAGRCPVH